MRAHRRTGNESPVGFIKVAPKSSGMLPGFPDSGDDEQAVDLTGALMGTLVDRSRDFDHMKEEYEARIAQLQEDVRRMRRQSSHANTVSNESQVSEAANIFNNDASAAKQRALEHAMELDKAALDKFEDFRRAYEECEPSLRTNRAQFAGERPLSPPPARNWNGAKTPLHQMDLSDHESRLATVNAAEVRRAGEDLMSTPVRRKTQRAIRVTSTRRTAKSRLDRPMFSGESDLSDNASDDGGFNNDDDDHRDLRNCLMSASNFGTFLVQYVTRQCLDYNTLCDDNKMLMLRYDEIEKKLAQIEKHSKRLEESRDEQVAQAYEMSAQRELLSDKIDAAERNARRLANENDKLKHDLALSNERCESLDDQIAKLNSSLAKSRQRYEQEITTLRRNANSLQQDKTVLAKKNDELRVELKGKLQRAGLKANVDEYLAERKKESASAADGKPGSASNAAERSAGSAEFDGASAEQEIKRLQESVQFWRKKTDRLNRKLRTEKINNKEASKILRLQQEETYRYQQLFGPLPDDVAGENMESLGDYLPGMLGGSRRPSSVVSASGDIVKAEDKDAARSTVSGVIVDEDKLSAHESADSDATDDLDQDESKLARPDSSSGESGVGENDEDSDDRDIRRYEQRIKNRRANLVTPRNRRAVSIKSAATAGSKRTMAIMLPGGAQQGASIVSGEALSDILGASSLWGEKKPGKDAGVSPKKTQGFVSLASELNGLGGSGGGMAGPTNDRPYSPPRRHSRNKSSRSLTNPFSEELGGFGIGFSASVSLAEQLAASAQPGKAPEKPKMVDASTSTDPLPEHANAQTTTLASTGSSANMSVQASLALPSADAAVATASTEPGFTRSTSVEPSAGIAALVNGGVQTETAHTKDLGMQAVAAYADQQCLTDPRIGARNCVVDTVPSTTTAAVQLVPSTATTGITTDISVMHAADKCVGDAVETAAFMVQVAPETASTGMATDRLIGAVDAGTSVDVVLQDRSCQITAELKDTGVDADRLFNTASQSVEAVPDVHERSVAAGADSTRDTAVATTSPVLVDRGSATIRSTTNDAGASTDMLLTSDVQVSTDDSVLAAWLAPLIPAGIAVSTVLAALSRSGEPVHELHARQVAEATRSAAAAEHARAVALAAEEAAANAKQFVDKAVSYEVSTNEQAVQAEPKLASKSQQAGSLSTTDAGIDAQAGPATASVAVGTERTATDRWTDPSDPVEKSSRSVDAVSTTADRATSQDVKCVSVAAGPTIQTSDAYVRVRAVVKEHATAMDAWPKDASVGPAAEQRDCLVEAGLGATRAFGVDTVVAVAEKAEGPSCEMADRSVGNAYQSHSRSVDAGASATRDIAVDTGIRSSSKTVGPVVEMASVGTGDDAKSLYTDAYVGPDSIGTAHANVSAGAATDEATVSTHDAIPAARSVQTATASVVDAHTQAQPEFADASAHTEMAISTDIAVPATCDANIATSPVAESPARGIANGKHAVASSTQSDAAIASAVRTSDASVHTSSVATATAGVATEPSSGDNYEHVSYPHSGSISSAEGAKIKAVSSFDSVSDIGALAQTAEASPDISKPAVPASGYATAREHVEESDEPVEVSPQTSPALVEGSAGSSPEKIAVRERSAVSSDLGQAPASPSQRQHQRKSSTPEPEDFGYIVVSPRTQLQHASVSSKASSQDSLPETPTKGMKEALALLDGEPCQSINDDDGQHAIRSEDAEDKEQGGDLEEGAADNLSQHHHHHHHHHHEHHETAGAISLPGTHSQDQRMSMSIGVETSPQSYYARQPEPLIVQAIARTMVGAYMWKYTPTRFTHTGGRERRHMRYFWIHPYAKMLNWSKQPPTGGTGLSRSARASGSRSVYMRSIRIVADQQPGAQGSGEPSYSIVITTDHREVKIKATSQADHDMWYMAMSYLQSRRIINSTTYPAASVASGDNGEYFSDASMHSRVTSIGSAGGPDGRHNDGAAERSSSRTRMPVQHRGLSSHFPLPASIAATPMGSTRTPVLVKGEFPPPHPGVSSHPSNSMFSHTSHVSHTSYGSGNNESVASNGTSVQSSQQRSFRNTADGSVSSLQTTPKSLRPISMMPNTTPRSEDQKHMSMGFFRKGGGGGGSSISSSLVRHGSHTSDGMPSPPSLRYGNEGSVAQPHTIASALSGTPGSAKRPMSGSRTVRKMFSGSILRVLKSRDPADDEMAPA
ncbi:hypothetical protein GGI12_002203 [Dipsacomyces acuminosporus]|nr:hypothetical protein GGI12_002203 [Dipsacomyces acuminosporus]